MTTGWVWALSITLFVLFLGRLIITLRARRDDENAARAEAFDEAVASIEHPESGIQVSDLREAWTQANATVGWREDENQAEVVQRVDTLPDDVFAPLLKAANRNVNGMNADFARAVDEGRVRLRDLARLEPELYLGVLEAAVLCRPLILHQAVFAERGRWGYRVLQLEEEMGGALRSVGDPDLRRAWTVSAGDHTVRTYRRLAGLEQVRNRLWLMAREPRITRRRKVGQNKEMAALRRQVKGAASRQQEVWW